MSRSTGYFIDCNVGGSLDHRDAIITSADDSPSYFHIVGMANVDAISVGAIFGSNYVNLAHPNIITVSDENMYPFAVEGSDASQNSAGDLVELYVLLENEHKK